MAKKLGCASCGGTKKMAKGGPINKPMTYAKRQTGDSNQHMGIFGMPNIGQGAMDGKTGQMKKGGAVKKLLVKAQSGRTVKTYKNTPYSKETIVSKSSKGSMIYEADKKGNVTSLKPSTGSMISMDTTGYAAGKKSFPLKSTSMTSSKTTNVPRSKVKSTIDNMKKEVKSSKKMGGVTKSKKK